MTPERFRQVRNLFDAALDREGAARAAYLAEACQGDEPLRGEIERLLAAHLQPSTLLDAPAVRPQILEPERGRMEGRRIGSYEILRELGRGGMGAVYLAVRADHVYRKPVALKLVRAEAGSREVVERFRREREILASLDHPNLARLLDGGTTPEGLPYFVMDYVDGKPIDAHCDERRMSVAERLKLFRTVCDAVEYAHSRGVVHRDLKPANILVTAEGTVKLLDFGIAKLLRAGENETTVQVTRAGMLLMTPEYASPEQVRRESVGTASDVYSLGVVLYELLTGHRPYRMRSRLMHEVVRVISEEEPEKPSTAVTQAGEAVSATPQSVSQARASSPDGLRRQLTGGPDKIVLKTLRKEPAGRYRSAAALGEDIGRHLDGLPVEARGQGLIDSAGRVLVRHRAWALAAFVAAIALASGAVKISFTRSYLLLAALVPVVLTLPVAYLARRRLLGREQASSTMFPFAVFLISVSLLSWTLIRLSQPFTLSVVGALCLSSALYQIGLVARWRSRERWAGALLLDISSTRRRSAYVQASILAAVTVVQLPLAIAKFRLSQLQHLPPPYPELLLDAVYVVWAASLAALTFLSSGRWELRGRGIVLAGLLVPWSRIESYAWEPAKGDLVLLKLRRQASLSTLYLSGGVPVSAKHKNAADAILARQLSEWPSR